MAPADAVTQSDQLFMNPEQRQAVPAIRLLTGL